MDVTRNKNIDKHVRERKTSGRHTLSYLIITKFVFFHSAYVNQQEDQFSGGGLGQAVNAKSGVGIDNTCNFDI